LAGVELETAWVSGSLAEGLHNASSDLDVFVLVERESESSNRLRQADGSKVYHSNANRIEYAVWTRAKVERLRRRLQDAPLGAGTKLVLEYLTEAEVEFLHRLRIGQPVTGAARFAELRASFDFGRLARYLFENQCIIVDDAFDDAVGMLTAGAARSAALRARYTVECSMSLLLFSRGVTNHKDKHRERLLERLRQQDPSLETLYGRFWGLIARLPDTDDELATYVRRALAFAEEVVDVAETD
jgi:predicted nucleotidyltransferase